MKRSSNHQREQCPEPVYKPCRLQHPPIYQVQLLVSQLLVSQLYTYLLLIMRLLSVLLPLLLVALVCSEGMMNYREDYQAATKKFAKEGGLTAADPEAQKEHKSSASKV